MKNKKFTFNTASTHRKGDPAVRFLKWAFFVIGAVISFSFLYERFDHFLLTVIVSVMTPFVFLVMLFPDEKQIKQCEIEFREHQEQLSEYHAIKSLYKID